MSELPDDYLSNNEIELSETQKFGKGLRWFGFARLGAILGTFIVSLVASAVALQNVDMSIEDLEVLEQLMTQELNKILASPWITLTNYVIEAIVVIGLIYFVIQLSLFFKFNEGDLNIKRVYYLFIASLLFSFLYYSLSLVSEFISSAFDAILLALDILGVISIFITHGLAIAAYYLLKNWAGMYERQMGAQFPILSSRFRRMLIGEIMIIGGQIGIISIGFLSILVIFGEIFIGINLLRAGKILMLDTFPQTSQTPFGSRYMPRPSRVPAKQVYPEEYSFQQPEKLIPDKAYFCPSCGKKLVAASQDFCMSCGKPIPRPDDNSEPNNDTLTKEDQVKWKCKFCGAENANEASTCENCGEEGRSK